MVEIIVRRTAESTYELEIDGSVVETYNQTVMAHPWDWERDALDNGATKSDIRQRNYGYIDVR
jgi:hypothetical protein